MFDNICTCFQDTVSFILPLEGILPLVYMVVKLHAH